MILSLFLICVSFSVMLPLAHGQGDEPGLPLAAWLFDEGVTKIGQAASGAIEDGTGHGFNGKIFGNVKWRRGLFGGSALQFNPEPGPADAIGGAAFVKVPYHKDLDLNIFTMTAWIKVPRILEPSQMIVGKRVNWPPKGADLVNYSMWVCSSQSPGRGFPCQNPGNITCGFFTLFPGDLAVWIDKKTTKVTDDQWHFVACSYDGDVLTTYVDGKEEGKRDNKEAGGVVGKPVKTEGVPLMIGARPIQQPNRVESKDSNFDVARDGVAGIIDDVALWNVSLDIGEINSVMNMGLAAKYDTIRAVDPSGKLATKWGQIKSVN
jgi:hypothetical protein